MAKSLASNIWCRCEKRRMPFCRFQVEIQATPRDSMSVGRGSVIRLGRGGPGG
jgi:hypothetical protein